MMTLKILFPVILSLMVFACKEPIAENSIENSKKESVFAQEPVPAFDLEEASRLLELPLTCFEKPYPYKTGHVLEGAFDLKEPREVHPVFYGCFDWHSAVHAYWSMVALIKAFPELEKTDMVKALLRRNITRDNILVEKAYFEKESNKSFERTYGWAWLLKLAEELHTWNDPLARELENNLQPLTDMIVRRYKEFLPVLVYPIRVGEHTNTAFGLTFAYDYAQTVEDVELKSLIKQRARYFYGKDTNCPIDWEPSGYDFLSPCLEEVNIMRRVLPQEEFLSWLNRFMPELQKPTYHLPPGEVSDRTDGKLVHLDGLNFSRAWSFYALAKQYPQYIHLKNTAHQHINHSLPNLVGDTYEGGHWLGSFAIYALKQM